MNVVDWPEAGQAPPFRAVKDSADGVAVLREELN